MLAISTPASTFSLKLPVLTETTHSRRHAGRWLTRPGEHIPAAERSVRLTAHVYDQAWHRMLLYRFFSIKKILASSKLASVHSIKYMLPATSSGTSSLAAQDA